MNEISTDKNCFCRKSSLRTKFHTGKQFWNRYMYMLFAGWEVRIVKKLWRRAILSGPRSQVFTIRTKPRPANTMFTFFSCSKLALQITNRFVYASINSSGAHPPRATAGHLLTLSVPGVGHSQFYRDPGGWALAYPGATPGHLTRVFSKDGWVYREERGLCQRLTCLSETRKACRWF